MRILPGILDFLVHSSILVSLIAASITYMLFKLAGVAPNYIMLVPFFTMFAIYNFNRKTDMAEDTVSDPKKSEFTRKYNKYFLGTAALGYGIAVLLSFARGLKYGAAVLVPFAVGYAYSEKWIPSKSGKMRIKDMLVLKNLVVALTWAYAAIIPPLLLLNLNIGKEAYFLGFVVFSRLFINAIFFDIKDVAGDSKTGTRTIPSVYGTAFTDKFLVFLNAVFLYVMLVAYFAGLLSPLMYLIGFFTAAYGFFYFTLYKTRSVELSSLSYVIADGELILAGLLVYSATSL